MRARRFDDERGFSLVELIVVIGLTSIIATATLTVVSSTTQGERYTRDLSEVMNDARLSMDNAQRELRAARRVLDEQPNNPATAVTTDATTLNFWVDRDQDHVPQPAELVTYQVQELCPGCERYELVRWTQADVASNVVQRSRVLAGTLLNVSTPSNPPSIFTFDVAPQQTRVVTLTMDFQVDNPRAPSALRTVRTVRLRNVA